VSNPIPDQIALAVIADGSPRIAAPVRNNYSAVQAAVNELIAALEGGSAGQVLRAVDASTVEWAAATYLFRKNTVQDVVSTTAPTDLLNGEITIPAETMGVNSTLWAHLKGDFLFNGQATPQPFVLEVKFGGVSFIKGSTFAWANAASRGPWELYLEITNDGAANSQDIHGWIMIGPQAALTTGVGGLGTGASKVDTFLNSGLAADTTSGCPLVVDVTNPFSNATCSFRLKTAVGGVI
jgi:hypothetical protein